MPLLKNMYNIAIIVIHFRNSDKFAGTFAVKRDTSTQRLLYSSIQLIALKHGSNLGGSVLLRLSCVTYWLWHQNTSKLIICKAAVIRVAIWDSGTRFKFGTWVQDSNTGARNVRWIQLISSFNSVSISSSNPNCQSRYYNPKSSSFDF